MGQEPFTPSGFRWQPLLCRRIREIPHPWMTILNIGRGSSGVAEPMEISVETRAEAHRIAREYLHKERVLGDDTISHYIVNQLLDKLGFPQRDPIPEIDFK